MVALGCKPYGAQLGNPEPDGSKQIISRLPKGSSPQVLKCKNLPSTRQLVKSNGTTATVKTC